MPPSAHSNVPSAAASDLARRLVAREVPERDAGAARLASAERLSMGIVDGLARWFGPDGSRALVARALATARRAHPALHEVRLPASGLFTGLPSATVEDDASAVIDGLVTMIAALADLLGRLLGDDLAVSVLEQSATSSAGVTASAPYSVSKT
jgi:hypothetical protein